MPTYKYHLYHSEEECSKEDLLRDKLTEEQIEHEYDSLETELHLFSRSKELDIVFEIDSHSQNGVIVKVRGISNEQEADDLIGEFPEWLKKRIPTRFCPIIKKLND